MADENRLRAWGGLLVNPAPLECSFNECTRCRYCFALLDGRLKHDLTAMPTLRHIEKVFRYGGNPIKFADKLLLAKHPIVYSNSVDPCFPANMEATRAFLPTMKALGVPLIFQSRGTDRVADFGPLLDDLPDGSVYYCSLTEQDENVRKQFEPGSPSFGKRLEMICMAGERGIPVVAALNPVDQDMLGNIDSFFAEIERVVPDGVIQGCWAELLHLSRRQSAGLAKRNPTGLPVLLGQAAERACARPFVADEFWIEDLFQSIDAHWPRRYSYNIQWANKGRSDLFDLWPNPFITHHGLVAACQEVSAAHDGGPVAVTFEAFCSFVDPYREYLDWEISKKDAWYWLNIKQTVPLEEGTALRQLAGKTLSIEECLRFIWNNPRLGVQAVYGAYGIKCMAEVLYGDDDEPERLAQVLRDDDSSPLAVYAPQERLPSGEDKYQSDKKDRYRLYDEVERGLVLLAPFDEDEDLADAAP